MKTLLEIFSDYNPKTMGNGQIRMECPFRENHKDGSGRMSFFITPEMNAYHCFSCHKSGNLLKLLTTKFGVNYFEAAEMVNLVPYRKERVEFDLDTMWDFNKPPYEFVRRGITPETLKHFRVGTTDDGAILIPYYEDFENPVKLLGYQKRWYEPERKVINSKGFDKKDYLYKLPKEGRSAIVLVEGQSDVWKLHQIGFRAVALMGSSLSQWQTETLSKFKTVYLALDNDIAGRRATEAVNRSLQKYTTVMLVPYVSKDPGEATTLEWDRAIENATDYLTYSVEMSMNWDGYLEMRDDVLGKETRSEKEPFVTLT